MAKQPQIYSGGFYHVYNRGVDKRRTFMDDRDRVRFIHDLYEFNDREAAPNMRYHYGNNEAVVFQKSPEERDLLIDIVSYAFMPNHYHLLLRSRTDDGISLFMQKLGTGYTLYFNERYSRSGSLFQGTYKTKEVDKDSYLRNLTNYIHINPLELFTKHWKKGNKVSEVALRKFENYRWSSYRDYIGKKNFPSLLNLELIHELGLLQGKRHQEEVGEWVKVARRWAADIRHLRIEE